MKQLKVRVQHRYDTAAVWNNINPILEAGEMGIESDTGRFKYGDGRKRWRDIEYAYGSGIQSIVCESVDQLKDRYPAENHPGQIAIVPQTYTIDGKQVVMDTPYISLRKSDKWFWVIFADQKDTPLVTNILDAFVLDVSPLG